MTDVKDNLEYLLNKYELVENGIPAMGDLRTTRDKFKQAILEEMDRVIADLIGDDDKDKAPYMTPNGQRSEQERLISAAQNTLKRQLRHRWQEVRGRL